MRCLSLHTCDSHMLISSCSLHVSFLPAAVSVCVCVFQALVCVFVCFSEWSRTAVLIWFYYFCCSHKSSGADRGINNAQPGGQLPSR